MAYFKSPEEAEGVALKLRVLRVLEVSIDRFSRYGGTSYSSGINAVTGNVARMDSMTAGISHTGILAAADTSSSGMSHGGNGGPTGVNILLTVIVDSESYDQALRLIEEAGGMI